MPAVGSGQGTVADDRAALEALYDATNGANWSRNDNWKTDEPLGQWFGVTTYSDGRVIFLDLSGNQSSGTIPGEIGKLTSLEILILDRNQSSGLIPAALGNLTSLFRLDIDTTTGLCLAPDFDLASPFATQSGLSVCAALTPKAREVVQAAVNDAIAAATDGEGLRTGGSSVTVP